MALTVHRVRFFGALALTLITLSCGCGSPQDVDSAATTESSGHQGESNCASLFEKLFRNLSVSDTQLRRWLTSFSTISPGHYLQPLIRLALKVSYPGRENQLTTAIDLATATEIEVAALNKTLRYPDNLISEADLFFLMEAKGKTIASGFYLGKASDLRDVSGLRLPPLVIRHGIPPVHSGAQSNMAAKYKEAFLGAPSSLDGMGLPLVGELYPWNALPLALKKEPATTVIRELSILRQKETQLAISTESSSVYLGFDGELGGNDVLAEKVDAQGLVVMMHSHPLMRDAKTGAVVTTPHLSVDFVRDPLQSVLKVGGDVGFILGRGVPWHVLVTPWEIVQYVGESRPDIPAGVDLITKPLPVAGEELVFQTEFGLVISKLEMRRL